MIIGCITTPRDTKWTDHRPAGALSGQVLGISGSRGGDPIRQVESGQSLDLGDSAVLQVLAVTGRGMVLLLEWGSFWTLLPAGLDFVTMEALDPCQVTAVLMAENGYAPLNTREWIEGLSPQVVLLSVAAGDRDGLPDPEALQVAGGSTCCVRTGTAGLS